ncbi:serine/threonine-protein kinase [Sorangium cellulosum]|uniref:serine/threonine-protein kinase n=1 Tax=Sorangium cellulosum TaxID=56 RepID=UPI001F5DB638|nr:serine/threonine-protein kinase [Sorangium cellulosum]
MAAGDMGEVWAARLRREHGFQKLFAIKLLRPELSPDPEVVRRFLDEAALAARIRHPNVVPVVDLGAQDGVLFQVMEWVSGEPLSSVLRAARGRPAPVLAAARIAYQICAALDAAHELRDELGNPRELVHYDVSPDNVLVTSEGLVRLVDFGIAKFEGERLSERCLGAARGDRGRAREAAGREEGAFLFRSSAPYMAPEHIRGQPCDRRADLFGVGLLLYELLSGAHPFQADDSESTMTHIASERPAAPLSSRAVPSRRGLAERLSSAPPPEPIPPALDRLVSEALAKSPTARTATASQLMRALEEAVPGSAHPGNDAMVAAWIGQLLGGASHLRTQRLRAALEALDPVSEAGEEAEPGPRPRIWVQAVWALGVVVAGCALAGTAAVGHGSLRSLQLISPAASAGGNAGASVNAGTSVNAGAGVNAGASGHAERSVSAPPRGPRAAATTAPRR